MSQNRTDRALRVFAPEMIRLLTVLLLVAGLALASDAGAATKPSFTFVGDTSWRALQSDARHAAFERPDGTVTVYDAVTNRFSSHAPPQPGCPFQDVGGGKLLWSCGTYTLRVITKKLRTGQVKSLDVRAGEIGGAVSQVGTYWAGGTAYDHRGGVHDVWWSLADGSARDGSGNAREVEDLNEPALIRPLCSPLRRRDNPDADYYFDYALYRPYSYDGRYGLTWNGAWEVDECGRRGTRDLPEGAVGVTLVGGRLGWVQGAKVAVRDLRTGRTLRWGLAGIDPEAKVAAVRVTRKKVFVTTADDPDDTTRRVYAARLPG